MPGGEPLSSIERQEQLAALIRRHKRITVTQVCDRFGVSAATARRDLDAIVEQGRAQRVHGGAIAPRQAPPEGPALQRAHEQSDEKRRIGQAAARLVAPGETVLIGSGTTALEVARHLTGVADLTVITNSLLVLNLLADHDKITVVSLGGMLRRTEMSLIGHITGQSLVEVRANKVFMGIRSIDVEHGLTNDYLPETVSDREILKSGRQAIIVADHTKCGRVSASFVAPVDSVNTLITDTGAPAEFVRQLKRRGVEVITA